VTFGLFGIRAAPRSRTPRSFAFSARNGVLRPLVNLLFVLPGCSPSSDANPGSSQISSGRMDLTWRREPLRTYFLAQPVAPRHSLFVRITSKSCLHCVNSYHSRLSSSRSPAYIPHSGDIPLSFHRPPPFCAHSFCLVREK